ncbi:MAG: NupC/NupG family nucleoside CNT transporter [Planctomycetota bacterium]|nr:MAG: NupC/NupG family nucleoside CNT transporter [Planctomycetota bacterium]
MERLISLVGLFAFIGIAWLFSTNRRAIRWRTVFVGLLLQVSLGLLVLYWDAGNAALCSLSYGVKDFLALSKGGAEFVFGVFAQPDQVGQVFGANKGFVFAFAVLPTIIFFSAVISVLWHLGIMQHIVRLIAHLIVRVMGTSGSETLAVASNIFVGQTEAPFLIKPFLPRMTRSELMAVMTGGFATIAGGVFALYVLFGVDAGHLIVASVMSAPAALVVAKVMVPETETSETFGTVPMDLPKTSSNVVEAAANGTVDGLKLAVNVGAMLIAFLGLVAVVDWLLSGVDAVVGGDAYYQAIGEDGLTLRKILGWAFSPFAVLLGVPMGDVPEVGQLLGTKVAVTELIAYDNLRGFIEIDGLRDLGMSLANIDVGSVTSLKALPAPESFASVDAFHKALAAGGIDSLSDLSQLQALMPKLSGLDFSGAKDYAEWLAAQPAELGAQIAPQLKALGLERLDALQALTGQAGGISKRSILISTYALCGFANLGSIGIQIGGIAALCPERRKDLSQLAVRAMFAGAFASWMTACVAGVVA